MCGDLPRDKDDFIIHTCSCFHHYFGVMDRTKLRTIDILHHSVPYLIVCNIIHLVTICR